jgi:hypothetical protein
VGRLVIFVDVEGKCMKEIGILMLMVAFVAVLLFFNIAPHILAIKHKEKTPFFIGLVMNFLTIAMILIVAG